MIVKEFPATLDAFPEAQAFFEEELEKAELPMKVTMQMSIAFEEVFVNIAHYAYPDGEEGKATIELIFEDGVMTFRLKDSGIPFDPLAQKDPDITLGADDRDIGGLGIFMTKKYMDDISYEYKDSMNILTMKKKYA